jgi:hypothetical protein
METSEKSWKERMDVTVKTLGAQMEQHNITMKTELSHHKQEVETKFQELAGKVDRLTTMGSAPPSINSFRHSTGNASHVGWEPQRLEIKGFCEDYFTESVDWQVAKTWMEQLRALLTPPRVVEAIDWELSMQLLESRETHGKFMIWLKQPSKTEAQLAKMRILGCIKSAGISLHLNGRGPRLVIEPSPQEAPFRTAGGRAFALMESYRVAKGSFTVQWNPPLRVKDARDEVCLQFDGNSWTVNIEPMKKLTKSEDTSEQIKAKLA